VGKRRRSGSSDDAKRREPRPDRAADRALFEQALERLDREGGVDRGGDDEDRAPQRPARFDKRVARGEIEPDTTIDLHGLDRDQAAERLRRFLSTTAATEILVIHGRGAGIVRAAAVTELDRHPRVAEHVPAPRRLGGEGARLVRMRR
jgi:DNA-nicking Smr family endonuclease